MGVYMPRMPLCGGVVVAALTVLGCGHDEALTPVRGRVFFRGQPLPVGTIVFTPDAEPGGHGPLAIGEIGPDGRYSLRSGDKPGAGPGRPRPAHPRRRPRASGPAARRRAAAQV